MTKFKYPVIVYLKKEETWKFKENNLSDADKAGVWALYGRKQGKRIFECLEVGETNSFKKEINNDIGLIKCESKINNNKYIRRLKPVFKWSEMLRKDFSDTNLSRQEAKYRHISAIYSEMFFLKIYEDEENNRNERLKKEAEFAIENNAIFWRPVGIQWNDERVKNAPKWEG